MSLLRRLQAEHHARALRAGHDPSGKSALEARGRLLALGDAALPALLDILRHADARRTALDILDELLTDRTLPAFMAALASPHPEIAAAAAELLARNRRFDPARLLDLLSDNAVPRRRVEAVLAPHIPRISPRLLVTALFGLGKEARGIVFRLLEEHPDQPAMLELTRLVDDPDWWMRQQAVRLLARSVHPESVAAAIRLLGDEQKAVRLEAVRTLARLRAGEAVPMLCRALADPDIKVHTAAIDALTALGDPAAVPHLLELLKSPSEQARRGAVEVLNVIATVDAVKDLAMALRDEDWWVRVRAADALGSLGGERVVEAVLALLADGDDFVRRYAVEILNTVSDAQAVGPLIELLEDRDWWVRERSIDALGRIGDSRAVDPLLELLVRDSQAAPLCVRALRAIGDVRALPMLGRLVNSDSQQIRREAVDALVAFSKRELPAPERELVAAALAGAGVATGGPAARPMDFRLVEMRPAASGAMDIRPDDVRPAERRSAESRPAASEASRPRPLPVNYHDLVPGNVLLDRFRVIRKIGGGGFGSVYLVEDAMIKDDLVLKVLSPHLSQDDSMIRRFAQELRLTRRISHPAVIRIHDILDLGGTHAISMEYFPGEDLSRLLKRTGPLPAARGVAIARQACEALGAAHDLGIVHRDVKPANILVGQHDQVKIVDFGLAAVGAPTGSRLTRSGLLIGTPEYMAPEQITGGTLDARSDLYSLGAVLYEMFTGASPFRGETAVNVLFQHLEADVPPMRQVVPDLPAELDRVVLQLLAVDPGDRPASAAGLAALLAAVPVDRPGPGATGPGVAPESAGPGAAPQARDARRPRPDPAADGHETTEAA